jgi:hypothetical protein
MVPLPAVVFSTRIFSDGFLSAPPVPGSWSPGSHLHFRGPLGHAFVVPNDAKRVALVAFDNEPRRLLGLADIAIRQQASVTLVCDNPIHDLPFTMEVQPLAVLPEACKWSDYAAIDVKRGSLPVLKTRLDGFGRSFFGGKAEVLVHTPMPCGGLAACGICNVQAHHVSHLACLDGPVLDLDLLGFEG